MQEEFSFFKSKRPTAHAQVEKMRELSADLDFEAATWLALGINSAAIGQCLFNRQIAIEGQELDFHFDIGPLTQKSFHFIPTKEPYYVRWQGPDHHSFMGHLAQGHAEVFYNCNLLIDEGIALFIEKLKPHLIPIDVKKKELSEKEISDMLIQEERGREWLKVSLTLLKNAINQTIEDHELLLKASLWMGVDPKHSNALPVFRLVCFNLDIIATFQTNGGLRVCVFDDKNGEFGSSLKPRLDVTFELRQREVYDQLIMLLEVLGKAAKWPIPLTPIQ